MMFWLPLAVGPDDEIAASLLSAAQPAVAIVKNSAAGTTLRIERFIMVPRLVLLSYP
jgi:hypothetical protein